MEEPLVSILISAYNHEKYIEQCLDSIIKQTYKNIELIILNDGSIDDTDKKIRSFEDRLKYRFLRYIYINKSHEGVCRTLNEAMFMSSGKYVMTFASDDVMLPWRVELQVKFLENNKDYGVVYTDGYRIFDEGYIDMYKEYHPVYKFSNHMEFREGDLFEYFLENLFNKPTPTMCVRRECFDEIGKIDETMPSEDPDIYIRLAKVAKIGYIKQVLTIHRMHSDNSGVKSDIIFPLFEIIRQKYEKSLLLNDKQKRIFLNSLDFFTKVSKFN